MSNSSYPSDLSALRDSWGWILTMGICMMLAGIAAISMPFFTEMVLVTFLGIMMLVAGVAQIVGAFHCTGWKGVMLNILCGVLYLVFGFLFLENPIQGAAGLTLLLAAFFLAGGVMRIIISMQERFPGWGWTLLSGAVNVLLGLIVWRQFPESSLFIIGLLVGIEFLFNGLMWTMLSFAFKNIPDPGDGTQPQQYAQPTQV